MGVDLDHRIGRKTRKEPASKDVHLKMLQKLYAFLARRTGSDFQKKVAHCMCLSNTNKRPVSLSQLSQKSTEKAICVVVGKIVNDERLLTVPKMDVCALKFSETARARITAAGGKVYTFDQLALERPVGEDCLLVQGDRTKREACKHFGAAPGDGGSKTRPKLRAHGRKFEKARGRRNSRMYHA